MSTLTGEEILRQVTSSFSASLAAYQAYLSGGKTYQYALVLKEQNLRALQLLRNHFELIPAPLQPDAQSLIAHYDAWLERWNALEKQTKPSPSDLFVFENPHRFPREAAQRLEAGYPQLNKQ